MKVLLVNGSSRENGCTGAALREVERALQEEGIEYGNSSSCIFHCWEMRKTGGGYEKEHPFDTLLNASAIGIWRMCRRQFLCAAQRAVRRRRS